MLDLFHGYEFDNASEEWRQTALAASPEPILELPQSIQIPLRPFPPVSGKGVNASGRYTTKPAHPYQEDAIASVFKSFQKFKNTLVVAATGTGKTTIYSHVADRWQHKRVMIVAPRCELVRDGAERIFEVTGIRPAIEWDKQQSDENNVCSKIVISTVQTMHRRLKKFRAEEFGLLIIDEAHHDAATNKSYKAIGDHFKEAFHLGLTATPERSDSFKLGLKYDNISYDYNIAVAIDDGFLVEPIVKQIYLGELDFSQIDKSCGDFNQKQLACLYKEDKVIHKVAAAIYQNCAHLKTLVFVPSVANAEQLTEILNRIDGIKAAYLTGDDDIDERKGTLRKFKTGEVTHLVGCMIFTEGFDEPSIECVFLARKTLSRSLAIQMIGRGMRTLSGLITPELAWGPVQARLDAIANSQKKNLLVVDVTGKTGAHNVIEPYDIFGKLTDEERAELQKQCTQGKTHKLRTAISDAKKKVKDAKDRVDRRRAVAEDRSATMKGLHGVVKTSEQVYSLVDPTRPVVQQSKNNLSKKRTGGVLSQKQIDLLINKGFDPYRLSVADCKKELAKIYSDFRNEPPSPEQIENLARYDEKAPTKILAAVIMTIIKNRGWKKRKRRIESQDLLIHAKGEQHAVTYWDHDVGFMELRLFNREIDAKEFKKQLIGL